MKFEELKQSLTKKIENVYCVFGEDEFAKDSSITQIKNSVVDSFPELNYIVFSSEDIDEKAFFEALDSVPFFAEKKLIVLKLYGKKIAFMDRLIEYCKNPSQFCVLILVSDIALTFKNIEITPIDCNKISDAIITKYILIQVKNHNATIDSNAVNLLIMYCNSNMSFVKNELNKCLSYTNNITEQTIKEVASSHMEYQIYEFTNAIGKKNSEKTIEIMNNFLENKSIAPTLMSLLYSYYRRLYFISISNNTDFQLSEDLKIKPYAIKKTREQLKFYNQTQLKNILKSISDSDYNIKTGKVDLKTAIFNLVFSILSNNI